MNPSLPWDDWYDKLLQHDFDNAAGEQMANDDSYALPVLLTSFEARVLAETDEEHDEQWETMKQKWSNSEKRQQPQQFSLSHIFDRVEAVLKCRQLLQTLEELLEKQIYKVLGQQPTNPNQLPWLRNGAPAVNLKHCTPWISLAPIVVLLGRNSCTKWPIDQGGFKLRLWNFFSRVIEGTEYLSIKLPQCCLFLSILTHVDSGQGGIEIEGGRIAGRQE
eukprot:3592726-Rhodomonas_salina.1